MKHHLNVLCMYYNAVFAILMYILGHVPLFDLVFIRNIYVY